MVWGLSSYNVLFVIFSGLETQVEKHNVRKALIMHLIGNAPSNFRHYLISESLFDIVIGFLLRKMMGAHRSMFVPVHP